MAKAKDKKKEFELNLFPWDNDEKPYFVNPEGFEWYIDKDMTRHAKRSAGSTKGLKNVMCFFVKKGEEVTRVLIDDKQNVLYSCTGLEAMAAYIDVLKLASM